MLFIVGLMLETIAAITILTPVFLPVIGQIGISPIHFGVVMIGLLTHPFGVILFVLNTVTCVSLERINRNMVPFYVPLEIAFLLIIVFPNFVLRLPHAMGLL